MAVPERILSFPLQLAYPRALKNAKLFGQTGNDFFSLTPSTSAAFYVDGGDPVAPAFPRDTLQITRNGALLLTPLPSAHATSGTYFFRNRKSIQFLSIEQRLLDGVQQFQP